MYWCRLCGLFCLWCLLVCFGFDCWVCVVLVCVFLWVVICGCCICDVLCEWIGLAFDLLLFCWVCLRLLLLLDWLFCV